MVESKQLVLTQMNCIKGFSVKQYNIFITDKRFVFSYMTKSDKKETERLLNEKVKGKSFKERLAIIATHGYELPNRYNDMEADDILREHEKNFEIKYDDLIQIKIKRPKTKDSQGYNKQDYLVIKTNQMKLKVSPVNKEVLIRLEEIIGERVKVPFIIL